MLLRPDFAHVHERRVRVQPTRRAAPLLVERPRSLLTAAVAEDGDVALAALLEAADRATRVAHGQVAVAWICAVVTILEARR